MDAAKSHSNDPGGFKCECKHRDTHINLPKNKGRLLQGAEHSIELHIAYGIYSAIEDEFYAHLWRCRQLDTDLRQERPECLYGCRSGNARFYFSAPRQVHLQFGSQI